MLLRLLDMSTSKRIDVYTKTIILREFCNIYIKGNLIGV